ncbi:MAG TPA: hypothetical protein VMG60_01410 [Burkholderiaceae bacterium]|nr:hypothetical protein [Burkholderiaceae bacterium]
MKREFLLRCVAFVVAATMQGFAWAGTVAMVTEVQGQGDLVQDGKHVPLQVRAAMNTNDWLRLPDGARVAIALVARGQVFQAFGPGTFRLQEDGLVVERGARGRVERRELAAAIRALSIDPGRNAQATIVTRGDGLSRGFAMLTPKGLQLEPDARRLAWRPVDADRAADWQYHIVLSDDDGNVAYETTTRATEALIPGSIALVRGREYICEVIATGPLGRRFSDAQRFELVDAALEDRLLQARAAAGDDPTARTLLAIAYEEHGLAAAAAQAWQSLGASAQGRFVAAPPPAKDAVR